jgi:hypothetical protein
LIESGPRTLFAKQILKIIFSCEDVAVLRRLDDKCMRAGKFFSCRSILYAKTLPLKTLISSNVLQCLRHARVARRVLLRSAATSRASIKISPRADVNDARQRLPTVSDCFFHFAGVNDM